ncbi:MAG: molybdate ABC transporter substrate-binding protein [Pseudomonadota bacterium]|nr:molybdate ABC transporter substrate-binding protein [Pseudomonadota bacterium]
MNKQCIGMIVFAATVLGQGAARAADISVLSAAAVQVPLTELAERFEKATGNHVRLEFSTGGGVESKIRDGAHPDLVVNAAERLQAMAHGGLVAPGARSLGVVRMGVAVRKGGKTPDLSSAAAFRASLLAAPSIAYGDPARGATTGIHFAKVLERLGIQEAVKGKSILAANGLDVMKLVAAGEAEIGVTQISEILHVKGDTLAGPLPAELQLASNYSVALGSATPQAAAVQFADLLVSEEGRARFRHAGFE